jgi:hypothetical protein
VKTAVQIDIYLKWLNKFDISISRLKLKAQFIAVKMGQGTIKKKVEFGI